MKNVAVLLAFALSGAAAGAAFPPYDQPWLIWVAAASALVAATHGPFGVAAFGGFLYGLAQGLLLLPWLIGLFGVFSFSLFIIYAAYFAVLFGAVQAVAARWGRHSLLWAAPVLWVAIEWLRSEAGPLKFAWFCLGYTQHDNLAFLQTASVGGVYLLSFLIAGANGALAWFLSRPTLPRLAAPAVAAGVLLCVHGLGMSRPEPQDSRVLKVTGMEGENRLFSHWIEKLEQTPRDAIGTLVVLPEYAVPSPARMDEAKLERLRTFARDRNCDVLIGGSRVVEGRAPNNFENTLYLVGRDGSVQTQVKSVPIPFFLDGQAAKERTPLRSGSIPIGAAICYDMDFPFVTRDLVRQGAQILVYPTMDAREWGDVQHRQHAAMTSMRAVEHRRWVVRVASSGISQLIDPYGKIRRRTEIGESAMFNVDAGLREDVTFYAEAGYVLPWICGAGSMFLLLACAWKRHRIYRGSDAQGA